MTVFFFAARKINYGYVPALLTSLSEMILKRFDDSWHIVCDSDCLNQYQKDSKIQRLAEVGAYGIGEICS